MAKPFEKILVANRGEIAIRVIRACRTMGIRSVAVYSDADSHALHRRSADESIHIGPAEPRASYLDISKIILAAKSSGAEAIHPGYGFLSENPLFPEACAEAGIVFIGPSAESMRLMGNKVAARQAMIKAGVPVTPGLVGAESDVEKFRIAAQEAGYPVLIKAAAGGGGKGMRLVAIEKDLPDAIEAASREALKAFGDDSVYLEKYLVNPRHIEFQIIGDTHGNVVHLFERECSIQRRHQKIIEETPSVALSPALRAEMGEMAVRAGKAAKYHSTGTIECLLDQSGKYYFLEMNTRLQVEHPITEMVTGLDLVTEQIRIAGGARLSHEVISASQRGHAIECRVYAEDAENNFFPSSGEILVYQEPSGPGLRVDSGIECGSVVGVDYDPILAKIIVHGQTREAAIARMIDALERTSILGVKTSLGYMIDILRTKEFQTGATHTNFIASVMPEASALPIDDITAALAAGAVAVEDRPVVGMATIGAKDSTPSPWATLHGWRLGSAIS